MSFARLAYKSVDNQLSTLVNDLYRRINDLSKVEWLENTSLNFQAFWCCYDGDVPLGGLFNFGWG